MDVQQLVREATRETALHPDTQKFTEIAQAACSSPGEREELAESVRARLEAPNQRVRLMTLELLDFLGCVAMQYLRGELLSDRMQQCLAGVYRASFSNEIKRRVVQLATGWRGDGDFARCSALEEVVGEHVEQHGKDFGASKYADFPRVRPVAPVVERKTPLSSEEEKLIADMQFVEKRTLEALAAARVLPSVELSRRVREIEQAKSYFEKAAQSTLYSSVAIKEKLKGFNSRLAAFLQALEEAERGKPQSFESELISQIPTSAETPFDYDEGDKVASTAYNTSSENGADLLFKNFSSTLAQMKNSEENLIDLPTSTMAQKSSSRGVFDVKLI